MTYSLAIHGGAGTLLKENMTPEKEAAYHDALARALEAGEAILREGGSAMDAVEAAVCALENEPLFNAGRGAVYTSEGTQEMDAAVMDGRDRRAGSVAGVFGPKNPVKLARAVMERTEHVTLIGPNALEIARQAGLEFGDRDYFFTQSRWDALQEMLAIRARGEVSDDPAVRHGTVGAVARDTAGNIAAATSTGGMTAKAPGRVGDTPMIGAGTFADNATCAVSATGHGEVFIRWNAAGEIAARMRHAGEDLATAADHVVLQDLAPNDGSGGVIALDGAGNIAMPFNSQGMYRGSVRQGSAPETNIY
ncbi:MAG: isoaspartyl peptidase/L-asparaginase family protein [Sulfitobacter sp.]|jgi:beta-aspartyl-peptidase (threonine type)|uniref:isoaspartyl peptidase/L-asparaginase family protein n=1 Tax=unclassified Sulfitobacter TaxID=196795 RepID=UPI0007C25199|nr:MULTISPECIES: isoaspartyl peptidase/L-asparaginase [unclassified Sulfitobacter]KZX96747.1 beta-aspartyl-peptidase [Sulfitobacter sp. HI0027]KZX99834.1 beta-aspartyl-peptidase [Sulfitobacter sp. HI0021]KZZ00112.1 beta-aspartyl-peptidase [Sulfitobacter sp. HI0076]